MTQSRVKQTIFRATKESCFTTINERTFAELQAREYMRYEDLPMETADGKPIEVEFASNVCMMKGHRVIQCNIRDITDRKKKAKALELQAIQAQKMESVE